MRSGRPPGYARSCTSPSPARRASPLWPAPRRCRRYVTSISLKTKVFRLIAFLCLRLQDPSGEPTSASYPPLLFLLALSPVIGNDKQPLPITTTRAQARQTSCYETGDKPHLSYWRCLPIPFMTILHDKENLSVGDSALSASSKHPILRHPI